MYTSRLLSVFVLCALLCMVIAFLDQPAHAQEVKGSKTMDKSIAERRGVGGALASGKKEDEEEKGVTKVQAAIGIGSFLVMIAVVKWL